MEIDANLQVDPDLVETVTRAVFEDTGGRNMPKILPMLQKDAKYYGVSL